LLHCAPSGNALLPASTGRADGTQDHAQRCYASASSCSSVMPALSNQSFTRAPSLPREFYDRDPRQVAPGLLGKLLLRRWRGEVLAGRIVEVEAYLGAEDPAAHAAAGKPPRNAGPVRPPGRPQGYFLHGNHR